MNRVILIGRLTRDPEMRTTASGIAMTRFTVAVNRPMSSASREAGTQEQTDFISCVAWRRQAENIAKYCQKGSQVAVEGRIQTGQYDGADGQRHYTTEVYADNVTFLGSKNSSGTSRSNDYSQPMPSYNETVQTTDVSTDPFKDFGEEIALSDDDLPF